jgi:ABC-type branched-subunit amino acid transport system ATPase component
MDDKFLLRVEGLSRRFGGLLAVDKVSFDVPAGRIVALIGPNGAGKSTIVNLLSGVLKPSTGRIVMAGRQIAGLPSHAVARLGMVRTFQNGRLMPRLSVLENVLLGADGVCGYGFVDALLRMPRLRRQEAQLRAQSMALLDELGLAGDAARAVGGMAFGKQRKLEIARALMQAPSLLLLDEPAAGLNSAEADDLGHFVMGLRARGLGILLIEHNMGVVMRLADRIVVVNFGVKIAEGTPDEVRADDAVLEAYLGRKAAHAAV